MTNPKHPPKRFFIISESNQEIGSFAIQEQAENYAEKLRELRGIKCSVEHRENSANVHNRRSG